MALNFILLSILTFLSFSSSQSINCVYKGTTTYECGLILDNPDGFDNFTSIGGTHLENKSNADVLRVTRENGTSLNFPSIICEQFPNVIEIIIENAEVQILSENSFKECRNLINIDFNKNKIQTPNVRLLTNNENLTTFRIRSSNMTNPLPAGIFNSTPYISWICLENNPMENFLPQTFKGLTKMTELHIFGMELTELPKCLLRPMMDLSYFYAQSNQIKVLHQKSFPTTKNSLTYMNFDHNQIEAIDRKIFEDTPNLATVYFDKNVCIDRSFSNFSANRTIYMELLEPCFAEYDRTFPRNLTTCNFIEHPIYGYTCELINFNASSVIVSNDNDCLTDVDVTGVIFRTSHFDKIPSIIFETFVNLKFVEAINVGLESALIENCGENLKFIDVSHNSIKSLPSDSFECRNIEEIIMDHNCISSIQSCERSFMDNLSNLKKISMRGTSCVDGEFDLENDDVKKELRKCFGLWYLKSE